MKSPIDFYKFCYASRLESRIRKNPFLSDLEILRPGESVQKVNPARGRRVALVLPGSSVLRHLDQIAKADCVVGVNLASCLPLPFDFVVIERLGIGLYGQLQYQTILKNLTQRRLKVIVKNIWMNNRFDFQQMEGMPCSSSLLLEVPLRGSFALSKRYVVDYLLNKNAAFSSWNSSMFVCASLFADCGFESIDIYGMDFGGKYCWEVTDDIVVDTATIRQIASGQKHGTEKIKHKVSDVYKPFFDRLNSSSVCVRRVEG